MQPLWMYRRRWLKSKHHDSDSQFVNHGTYAREYADGYGYGTYDYHAYIYVASADGHGYEPHVRD